MKDYQTLKSLAVKQRYVTIKDLEYSRLYRQTTGKHSQNQWTAKAPLDDVNRLLERIVTKLVGYAQTEMGSISEIMISALKKLHGEFLDISKKVTDKNKVLSSLCSEISNDFIQSIECVRQLISPKSDRSKVFRIFREKLQVLGRMIQNLEIEIMDKTGNKSISDLEIIARRKGYIPTMKLTALYLRSPQEVSQYINNNIVGKIDTLSGLQSDKDSVSMYSQVIGLLMGLADSLQNVYNDTNSNYLLNYTLRGVGKGARQILQELAAQARTLLYETKKKPLIEKNVLDQDLSILRKSAVSVANVFNGLKA